MLKKYLLLLTITVTVFVVLFTSFIGCRNSTESIGENTMQKKSLVVALGYEPESGFDPILGWGRYGSPLFQSTLLKRDKDLKIIKDLATDIEVVEGGLKWVVKIRDDVKFSDGQNLDANDVAFTFNQAQNSGSVIDLNILQKAEAVDKKTVIFTLKEPRSTFVDLLISIGIVPSRTYGSGYGENPVGSGPFKFVQWDKGQQLIVKRNPQYYGEKPIFEQITFLFLSEDASYAAAKAGQVDIASIPATLADQKVPKMNLIALKSVDNRGIMFPFVKPGEKTEEGYLIGNDVTSDIAIRKAINVGINREALVDGVLLGYGSPAYTVCDRMPWWNQETVIEDNNPEEAIKIMENGGWIRGEDGFFEKEGLKASFTLIYPASDQVRQALALAVKDMVKQIGIDINVEGKSWEDIEKEMHSNAVLFGWGSYDPLEMYNLYSSKTRGEGWFNTGYYSNPVVDKYFEKALLAKTEEEAIEYWKKAQWDGTTGFSAKGDAPWAWLVNIDHLYLVNENLDIGPQKIQPHGHGWPVTDTISQWKWK